MKPHAFFTTLFVIIAMLDRAHGHGIPISVQLTGSQLTVVGGEPDAAGFASQLFVNTIDDAALEAVELPNLGRVALTDLPGFDVRGVKPGSGLSLDILARPVRASQGTEFRMLWYWDPSDSQVKLAPHEESLLLASEFGEIRIEQPSINSDESLQIAEPRADELNLHMHYLRYLLANDPAAAKGGYGFFAVVTSPRYESSNPFLIVLNYGLSPDELMSAAFAMNGAAWLPGDFDGDGQLSNADVQSLSDAIQRGTPDLHFDVNESGNVDVDDLMTWVTDLKRTWIGDANLDGHFDSSDLVDIFQVGRYETVEHADWSSGDWNADGRFTTLDIVLAFQSGGYEQGPRAATSIVPEPFASTLGLVAVGFLCQRRRGWQTRQQRMSHCQRCDGAYVTRLSSYLDSTNGERPRRVTPCR